MSEEVIQLIQQRTGVVAGLRRGLVVRDCLDLTPQVLSVSAVIEAVSDPPGVLSLGLSDALSQVALAVLRPTSSPALKAAQEPVDFPC